MILAVMIILSSVGPKNVPVGPKTGSISVTSSPSGASVYLDVSYKGTTPKTIRGVSAGSHTIKLSKRRYHKYTEEIYVKAGKRIKINGNLIPRITIEPLEADLSYPH